MKEKKGKGRGEDTDKTTEVRGGSDPFQRLLGLMFKAHPWHGVSIGEEAPDVVTAYIEIVPTDTVKYEVDKSSGFLKGGPSAAVFQLLSGLLRTHSSNLRRRTGSRYVCQASPPQRYGRRR